MKPLPFPYALNIGTDIVHIPRITRLLTQRPNYLSRFTTRILSDTEQRDFHRRFNGILPPTTPPSPRDIPSLNKYTSNSISTHAQPITPEITRWLAGRFAAKEAARKAAPSGAASLGWKDVIVRMDGDGDVSGMAARGHTTVDGTSRRPEVVYVEGDGGRVAKLSISHDGEYVVATVLAAG